MSKRGKAASSAKNAPQEASAAEMIAEAEELIPRMAAPLYKGCLRIAVAEAKTGSLGYLEEQLPLARARIARQDEESRAQAESETRRIAAMAAATSVDKVRAEHRKLVREQTKDYERWGKRRPDERTARKAHMSNRLDGRARRMSDLDAMHRVLTGMAIGGTT
jgi:hypothetical protein